MPYCSLWNIGHILLKLVLICLVLPPPSIFLQLYLYPARLLSTFLPPDLFSKYSLVAVFLRGFVMSTVAPVWSCCHHFFLCTSWFHFLLRIWTSFPHKSLFAFLSGQCLLRIFHKDLLTKTCSRLSVLLCVMVSMT